MSAIRERSVFLLRLRALPCAIAAALLATPSHALMLGEPEVRSHLGRPLDLRIPVRGTGADAVDASCFEVLAQPQGGASTLPRATLEVEQVGSQTYLRVRSTAPVVEPASLLRVRAACPPSNGLLVRQYGILLDPMPASAPSAPLVVESTHPVAAPVQLAAATIPPVARTPEDARSPRKAAQKARAPSHSKRAHAAATLARGGFHLKLSGPVLDLTPSRDITDAQRALLREARTLMDGDDYASAMLALRDRIDALQKRLEALQAEAVRMETSARAQPKVAMAPAPREPAAALRLLDDAWMWIVVALLGLAALLTALTRRRRPDEMAEPRVKPRRVDEGTETGRFAPPPPQVLAPAAQPAAPVAASIAMEDTEDAIRAARDLYNSGERLQAAGVLRLAIESHPERVAPWLPLFDLLMRERLATEYAELARGFRALHGSSPAWKTVQRAGRELDPANPAYVDEGEPRQVAA